MSIPTAPPGEVSIKEALVHAGLLDSSKAGRGKPSREMQDQADMLVRDHGYKIRGRSIAKSTTPDAPKPVVERVKVTSGKEIADIGNPIRREDEWAAYAMHDGKKFPIGMRTVCNRCGNSLTYCFDRSPKVFLDFDTEVVVNFRLMSASGKV